MDEYIKREDVIKHLRGACMAKYPLSYSNGISAAIKELKELTTADVVPKSNGKWKPYKDYFTHRQIGWICSNCSVVINDVSNGDTDYCPYCGAVMEGGE